MIKILYILVTFIVPYSCATPNQPKSEGKTAVTAQYIEKDGESSAYFASGCFWCVEAIFESVTGVTEAISGYAGGEIVDPSYQQVASGSTRHAEAVRVIYEPEVITYETLVKVFYGSHDPTTLNQQGPDRGYQYRSAIFYRSDEEKMIADKVTEELRETKVYNAAITTDITEFTNFYDAEEYHQDFERKNPNQSYVRAVSVPRLNRFKSNFPELLKEDVSH